MEPYAIVGLLINTIVKTEKQKPWIIGVHHLQPDWPAFLDDFREHWPTDAKNTYVDFIRDGFRGDGVARSGSARWRRICEERAGAKSVFHFDVPGSVAKSTHAGLPWLRYLRNRLGEAIHFWPFQGWEIPAGKSALVEVYPSDVYALEDKKAVVVNIDACIECCTCVDVCPENAIDHSAC